MCCLPVRSTIFSMVLRCMLIVPRQRTKEASRKLCDRHRPDKPIAPEGNFAAASANKLPAHELHDGKKMLRPLTLIAKLIAGAEVFFDQFRLRMRASAAAQKPGHLSPFVQSTRLIASNIKAAHGTRNNRIG